MKKSIRKFLVLMGILQIASNKGRNRKEKLGKGYHEAWRFNLWNPLSYLAIVILLLVALVIKGIIGIIEEWHNPFKWD